MGWFQPFSTSGVLDGVLNTIISITIIISIYIGAFISLLLLHDTRCLLLLLLLWLLHYYCYTKVSITFLVSFDHYGNMVYILLLAWSYTATQLCSYTYTLWLIRLHGYTAMHLCIWLCITFSNTIYGYTAYTGYTATILIQYGIKSVTVCNICTFNAMFCNTVQ
jgi:hypothetical protein